VKTELLETIRKDVGNFPGMPGVASRLLALLNNTETPMAEIEAILRYEPGLTANVLRLVNSAYFGIPRKVGSVRQAILFMGWKRLTQMVIASCVSAVMDKPVSGYDLAPGELWRHAIAVAVASEGLAKILELRDIEEIFTAGLLHDVGKMVLGRFVEEHRIDMEVERYRDQSFEKIEKEIFGMDHAEVGSQILANWGLPEALVLAVRYHHEPENSPKPLPMIDVVHIADLISLMIGIGVGREGLQYEVSRDVTERLHLEAHHLERVASQTLEWVQSFTVSLQPE
jgi:putative nucleotidyltransferase with HDIG domain